MGVDSYRAKKMILASTKYIILIAFSIIAFYPFYWLIINSLKEKNEIYKNSFALPEIFRFSNYRDVFATGKLGTNFLNSIIVSLSSVLIILFIASLAAYIIARVKFSIILYAFFTLGIMVPAHSILIPSFILIKKLGLYDSHLGLIIMYVVNNLSLAIFILIGFMAGLPKALEEAAYIDGCSRIRTFFYIILPLSKSGLATVATLSFLNCWNEYLFAYVLIGNNKLKTLTQGIMDLKGQYTYNYPTLCAGLVISIIPVLIMYMIFQEQIRKGMTAGAVKG